MWGGAVSVPAPWGDEGRVMPVFISECDRVVAVPGVKDRLLGVAWNGPGLVEGGLTVVCLPGGVAVQLLEVYRPPEGPVLLGADDHSVAPSVRGPQGDLLQDAKTNVSVQAGFHLILPVDGYGNGCVAGFGFGIGIDVRT